MAIRPSSARDVESLIQQLASPAALQRDAAIARLRVMAARARSRVLQVLGDPANGSDVLVAALRVLEGFDDPAVTRAAMTLCVSENVAVAVAAIQVLRPKLTSDTGVLERVASIVVDPARDEGVRLAALEAVRDLPESVTEPLVASVATQLADTPPLDTPSSAADWLTHHQAASLSTLHDLVRQARDRGRGASEHDQREWLAVRAAAHAALASRGSRVALYDAREMVATSTTRLPEGFVTTIRLIGDLSTLEPLARAWSLATHEPAWRDELRRVAVEIVAREHVTSRNPVAKRIRAKWPGFLP